MKMFKKPLKSFDQEFKPGDRCSGIGNCGLSDGKTIEGVLEEYDPFKSHAIIRDDKGYIHSVYIGTMWKVYEY